MPRVRRHRESDDDRGASFLELFFDLVFVFAITQVSHLLLDHLDWTGAGQAALALLVVWWAWQYTTWFTNELDVDSVLGRLVMLALMLAGLLMAIAIPEAFGDKALLFAGSYVAIQVGRQSFLTFVAAGPRSIERERSAHILIWFAVAGALWIAGALAEDSLRTALWLAALLIDYTAPMTTYRVPGRPRLSGGSWELGTSHFTERFGLFVIIALGESIILAGATTAELELDAATVAAFCSAFVATAALWWLYFTSVAVIAGRALADAAERVLLARDAYTYGHVLIVAGIILSAVGYEIVIAHPSERLTSAELLTVAAGPALFLLAQQLLRLRIARTLSPRRIAGIAACVAVALICASSPALLVGALLSAVLVSVVIADQVAAAIRARERS